MRPPAAATTPRAPICGVRAHRRGEGLPLLTPPRTRVAQAKQTQRWQARAAEPGTSSSSSPPPPPVTDAPSSSSAADPAAEAAARFLEREVEDASAKGETVAAVLGGAAALGAAVYALKGSEAAQQYAAGYLLEQALSVDNLFVFVLVFRYFKVPAPAQDRVLAYGIASAAVLRLAMVGAGAELIENFRPVLLLFAGILVFSSYKLAFAGGGGEEEGEEEDLSKNKIVQLCSRLLTVSPAFDGEKFFTADPAKPGASIATPLLLVLAVIELSDVVFAVDSVPAVFGVTTDPVIVWAASMAAIASLRAMYGFVATVLGELRYLDKAVAAVLGWVGVKMIGEYATGVEVPTGASLGLIAALLGAGVGASLWLPEGREGGGGA